VSARTGVLLASLAFVGLIVFVTVADAVDHGLSIRTVVSIPIVVILAVGVIGALAEPPRR
jgi:hypothetical protein